jgi:hypothetical protein
VKENEEKQSKKAVKTLIIIEWATQRSIEKRIRATFIQAWSPIAIRDVGDQFQNNFTIGLQISPYGYRGVNLGAITQIQRVARTKARTRIQATGHVQARHNIVYLD